MKPDAVLLLLVPQVFFWGSQSPFLLTKAVYLYLIGAFACLRLVLRWRRAPPVAGLPRALLAPALLVGYAAARGPWALDIRPEIATPFLWAGFLLVAWPVAAWAQESHQAGPRCARLAVMLWGLTAAHALLQSLGTDWAIPSPQGRIFSASFSVGPGQPPYATLGNPNFLGEYLAGILPLAVALATAASGGTRWLGWAAAGLIATTLPLTLARGPWLGALAGLAVLFPLRHKTGRAARRLFAACFLIMAFFLLAAAAMARWTAAPPPWERLAAALAQVRSGGAGRPLWWGATARMVADRPLTGVGEGNFRIAYPLYQARTIASLPDPESFAVPAAPVEAPHNDYLQVAAELGIPGLFLLLALLGLILWDAARTARQNQGLEEGWRAGSLGGLVALLVAALFSYPLHTASGLFLLALLAALAVAAPAAPAAPQPAPRWQWILLVVVTAFGFWEGAHLLRLFAASVHLHRGTEALLRGDLGSATRSLERAHEVAPRDSEIRVALGRSYLLAGRPDLALPHLRAGLQGFDSSPLRTVLGRAYWGVGQASEAEAIFRGGVAAFPGGYPPLHAAYGALLASQGRDAEAARELARALAHDPSLAEASYWSGIVRLRRGERAGAGAALRKFLELARPGDPRARAAEALLRGLQAEKPGIDNPGEPVK